MGDHQLYVDRELFERTDTQPLRRLLDHDQHNHRGREWMQVSGLDLIAKRSFQNRLNHENFHVNHQLANQIQDSFFYMKKRKLQSLITNITSR